jgi:hypothetical protein
MVMEREKHGDADGDGGGGAVPCPRIKWISDLCVTLSAVSPYLRRLCCELYTGAFTKVAWADSTKAVAGGTAARYGWALPIRWLAKASDAWIRGLFDLGILATRKSSLTILNFAQKVSKSAKENKRKDLHIFAIISH